MAWVTAIGSDPAQIEYRLTGHHGCKGQVGAGQLEYHTDEHERPLVWIGQGLGEVGIVAGVAFGGGDVERARALMNGRDPRSGEPLVVAKRGVFDDAKVAIGPLVLAVRSAVANAGGDVANAGGDVANAAGDVARVLATGEARQLFARMARQYGARGERARVRGDEAGLVAKVAGLDPDAVWGRGVLAGAVARLTETVTVTDADGTTRTVTRPRRAVVGNLGYDVSFTLPKSYSLLLAFADEETAGQIEAVYGREVGRTFAWLEDTTCYGMRGQHGRGRTADVTRGSGFLGWTMTHRAARPAGDAPHGDPHWHVHVTVANMARGEDGEWSTIAAGGRDLMRHAPAVDHVLKALVRRQLIDRFGVGFARNRRTKAWEVAAIPDGTLKLFSKRHNNIQEMLRSLGFDPVSVTNAQDRLAEDRTRQAKEGTDLPDGQLRAAWRQEALRAGHDVEAMTRAAFGTLTDEPAQDELIAAVVAAITDPDTGLTSRRRRFTTADAIAAVADAMPGGAEDIEQIKALTELALRSARVVDVRRQVSAGRDSRGNLAHAHLANAELYTTGDVVEAEAVVIAAAVAAAAQDQGAPCVGEDVAAMARGVAEAEMARDAGQEFRLSDEQSAVHEELVTSPAAVQYVVGPPGTGKTTLMRAARIAYAAAGLNVVGAATAAVAAQNLAVESGIASRTVAQWLYDVEASGGGCFDDVDVLVLDEANLTDDRARARLYEAALPRGVKIIEVGDPKQLRGVGCGSVFGYVADRYGAMSLTDNRRQADEDERRALALFRGGDYYEALQIWQGKGRAHITRDGYAAAVDMTAEWMRQRQGAGDALEEMNGLLMLASTNATVERINEIAHRVRQAQGELGRSHTYAVELGGHLEIAEGDWVMIRKNDRHERRHTGDDVLNGHRGVVETIDRGGAMGVRWREEGEDGPVERRAMLPASFVAEAVRLGYAMTVHKAEGLTVKAGWTRPDGSVHRGTVLVDPTGADTAGLYVAMSRHKGEVHVFAGLDALEDARTAYQKGTARTPERVAERGIEAMAEQLRARATNANDEPVLDQMGLAPEPDDRSGLARIEAALIRLKERLERPAGREPEQDPVVSAAELTAARRDRERRQEGPSARGGRQGPRL